MSIMAIVLGGMTSSIIIASYVVDDGKDPATKTADAAEVLTDITAELGWALQFRELTNTAVTFTVPDRDGDGLPETIRYAWSGQAGEALTRDYNGEGEEDVIKEVDRFALASLKRTLTPPPLACCNPDGTCASVTLDTCVAGDGEPMGPGTECAAVTCPAPRRLLFVAAGADPSILTATETARINLIESWDFVVSVISDSDTQANFDTAVATAEVAYVSEELSATNLGTKLTAALIGVVSEKGLLIDDLGLASGSLTTVTLSEASITDNSHYIASSLSLGNFTLSTSAQPLAYASGGPAAGVQVLATISARPSLLVAETGAELVGGASAQGRRVELPWGYDGFDFSTLTANSQDLMKRSIEWAARLDGGGGGGAVCGDDTCDAGEDGCTCPSDCGAPPAFEEPGVTCADGIDNDCDGVADCVDANCSTDTNCTVCGNGRCDAGEDCNSCAGDCSSVTGGPPSGKYCCGNGVLEAAEGDGSICDNNP